MNIFGILGFGRRSPPPSVNGIPTVKFDPKRVTPEVNKDIRAAIAGLPEIPTQLRGWLLGVATKAIKRGGDLHLLSSALIEAELPGVDKRKAAHIARYLSRRANALMTKTRHLELGITEARWRHSGSDCFAQMDGFQALRDGHAQANGKLYKVAKGLTINGAPTWPGAQAGCKCVSNPIIKGFDA